MISLLGVLAFGLAGVVWGWISFSAVHAIPYFYLLWTAVDVVCYWFVGRRAVTHASRVRLPQPVHVGLILLCITGFYVGNRLIGFAVLLNQPYFGADSPWVPLSEVAVLVAVLGGVLTRVSRAEA